jgi:hypothetical protein
MGGKREWIEVSISFAYSNGKNMFHGISMEGGGEKSKNVNFLFGESPVAAVAAYRMKSFRHRTLFGHLYTH